MSPAKTRGSIDFFQAINQGHASRIQGYLLSTNKYKEIFIANGTLSKTQAVPSSHRVAYIAWEESRHMPDWANRVIQKAINRSSICCR